MVIALGFDVGVGHQEHRQDERDDIPAREDEAAIGSVLQKGQE